MRYSRMPMSKPCCRWPIASRRLTPRCAACRAATTSIRCVEGGARRRPYGIHAGVAAEQRQAAGNKQIVVTPGNSRRGLDIASGRGIFVTAIPANCWPWCMPAPSPPFAPLRQALSPPRAGAQGTRVLSPSSAPAVPRPRPSRRYGRAGTFCPAHRSASGVASRANAEAVAGSSGATVADTVAAACDGADVICAVTAAAELILTPATIPHGCHVNAAGSSIATTRELDGAAIANGSLFVDRRESTVNESGDYLLALREGAIGSDHIRAEIGDVLLGRHPGRTSVEEITIYKSLGVAVQDLAAAELARQRARARHWNRSAVQFVYTALRRLRFLSGEFYASWIDYASLMVFAALMMVGSAASAQGAAKESQHRGVGSAGADLLPAGRAGEVSRLFR